MIDIISNTTNDVVYDEEQLCDISYDYCLDILKRARTTLRGIRDLARSDDCRELRRYWREYKRNYWDYRPSWWVHAHRFDSGRFVKAEGVEMCDYVESQIPEIRRFDDFQRCSPNDLKILYSREGFESATRLERVTEMVRLLDLTEILGSLLNEGLWYIEYDLREQERKEAAQ